MPENRIALVDLNWVGEYQLLLRPSPGRRLL